MSAMHESEGPLWLGTRLALRPAEAAAALGLSDRKFRELMPEIPHIRAGGAVLIPVDDLRRWLEERASREGGEIGATVREALRAVEYD